MRDSVENMPTGLLGCLPHQRRDDVQVHPQYFVYCHAELFTLRALLTFPKARNGYGVKILKGKKKTVWKPQYLVELTQHGHNVDGCVKFLLTR